MRALTDTLTVTDTVSVGYRYASLSVAFALLPDASQGDLCLPDSFLPGALGGLVPDSIGFGLRGSL